MRHRLGRCKEKWRPSGFVPTDLAHSNQESKEFMPLSNGIEFNGSKTTGGIQ